jgi:UDP-N-acetylmuramyl pentapeptide synthase
MSAKPGRNFARLRDAIGWRVRRLLGDQRVDRTVVTSARLWRSALGKPIFIGIAGSTGKTTTKELLLGVLRCKLRGVGNPTSLNAPPEVAKTILRSRPTHGFCVGELSEKRPGELDEALPLLRPSVGIVTVVGDDHWSSYGSRDGIAAEISKLVAFLPTTGTAVLNADDERVLAMAGNCAAKVLTYGVSPRAELRAEDISSAWPDRLELTLVRGAERVKLRTQLCGLHWIPSVLGAVGGGLAAGLSLTECAKGIASVAPFDGRMQPVSTADGVTFIRDDYKAPLWTMDACFDFMQTARAGRKIIVIGALSLYDPPSEDKYCKLATRAQEIADIAVVVGPGSASVLAKCKPARADSLRVFRHVRDAAEYINATVLAGDLVLLKGTNKQDHLLRIIMARSDAIRCWRDDCARNSFCDACPHRSKPFVSANSADGVSVSRPATS